jgi:protoheme IX farnesyltransferase
VGYTAVINHPDLPALILFLVLVFWQMPHFYAIALRRLSEYKQADIPVFPLVHGIHTTKVHIFFYVAAYFVTTVSLWAYGFAGYVYLCSAVIFGGIWIWKARQGFLIQNEEMSAVWAKKLFLFSLIVLVTFSLTIAISPLLHR